jgi:uncharacterized tellurite resistance protein B-like protein
MFAEFIKRLTQPDPAQLPDGDARLALTALLVRIAKSDNEYAPSERARIDQIMPKRWRPKPPIPSALPARSRMPSPMTTALP